MIINDARCRKCGEIFSVEKESILINWSDVICPHCPKCGSGDTFIKLAFGDSDVAEGLAGNAATGYGSRIANHPSKFGKFQGTKIKTKKYN